MSEVITLAHGSGGVETDRLIQQVFHEHLGNAMLDRQEDGAVFDITGRLAYTTDSFVVTPTFFRGGNIGKLAVCGTVNDLCMMGAIPRYLSVGFIIEQGMSFETLRIIARSIGDTAREVGVTIVAADTKVVEGNGGIYINTSGIGIITPERTVGADRCKEGDMVLVSGNIGDHHACIMSHRMGIENNIQSDVAPLVRQVEALFLGGVHPHTMRDITRGGLGTVINELAKASSCGFTLDEGKIPMSTDTRALSQILGLDPLYMSNEGTFLLVVDTSEAENAKGILRSFGNAEIIGECNEDTKVTVKGMLGGKRILPPLYGEGLPRIC